LENPDEDSDNDFGEVEQKSSPFTSEQKAPAPAKNTTSNKSLKRILDDDDDFEEEFETGDQIYYREEPPVSVVQKPTVIIESSANKPSALKEEEEDEYNDDEFEVEVEEEEEIRGHQSRDYTSPDKLKPVIQMQTQVTQKSPNQSQGRIQENLRTPGEDYRDFERERERDRILLEKFERETEAKIEMLQKEHYTEKRLLQNRVEVLEGKYSMYVDMISHPNQENVRSDNVDNGQDVERNVEKTESRRERKKRLNKEDDEFYKLHQEIMQEREKVLQAEVDYIMHNRINLLGGASYKK